MTQITLELDDVHLAAAARELGTTSTIETVTAALAEIAVRRLRAEAFGATPAAAEPSLAGHFLG
jgi:Arc/MetJ family transcription regulator